MNTQLLVASATAEQLLAMGIFLGTTALILLVLSTNVRNYREFSQWLAAAKRLCPRHRLRRRWYFNLPLANQGNTEPTS